MVIEAPTDGRAEAVVAAERREHQLAQMRLGSSGLHVSRLGLGMMSYGVSRERAWALDEQEAEPIVRRAIEAGITFFDTADMYSDGASEIVTGRLLRKLISREECVVATKVYYSTTPGPNGRGLSRKHLLAAIDASLGRLGMDYVDLYQIHRFDSETPIEETMQALDDVVRAGKARYVGASTMLAWQFAKAQHVAAQHGWTRFVSMQNRYNLLYREDEREVIPQCVDQGVAIIPYSPLAQGYLAGTRDRDGQVQTKRATTAPGNATLYGRPVDFEIIDRVVELARTRRVAPAQIALAWHLHTPAVTAPIIGATRVEHIDEALAATRLALSPDEIAALEEPYRPRNVFV
jgi:1-deoxyxylulose-5-phosphate synthase